MNKINARQEIEDEYKKITAPAWDKYNKIEAPAYAKYNKIEAPAFAKYQKIKETALAERNRKLKELDGEIITVEGKKYQLIK